MRLKIFIFIIILLTAACAIAPRNIPDKYNFDSSLETIDQIPTVNSPGLKLVDNQSVILRVNWNEYYLLVLRRPIEAKYSNPSIGIDRIVSGVTSGLISGHDRIYLDVVPDQYFVIDKIYKLNGEKQAEEITEQLRKG